MNSMIIKKVFNNNAALSSDDKGNEVIYTGCGICFGKKVGDEIDESKIEKEFVMSQPNEQFMQLVSELPYEEVQTADEIIKYAATHLSKHLSNNVYITLTDHLDFAIERKKKGIPLKNELLWEIKKYYKPEFAIGKHALEIIKERLGVELPEDEAGFFALHIVNAELDGKMHHTAETPEMLQDILNIVRYTCKADLDEDSLSYERFITHLKYFLQRAEKKQYYPSEDNDVYEAICKKLPESRKCAERIRSYMEAKNGQAVTDEEMLYLTVHISRVTSRK